MNRKHVLLLIIASLGVDLFGPLPATAQTDHKDSIVANIRLSPDQLKKFQGFFRSSQNKDMVVRFDPVENGLHAQLLWNNSEAHLVPESELDFVSKEAGDGGPLHLIFRRDSSGSVNLLDVSNNGTWIRVNDYKQVEKKEMEHTPGQLLPFEGMYQAKEDPSRFLQFTVRDNKLVLKQMWDGTEIPFVPESELAFFTRTMPLFSLDFTRDKGGRITEVLAFKKDVWIKNGKLSITPAILKSYEGKYRSQEDPDNEIRIIATDSNLVVRQLWDKKDRVLQPLTSTFFNNQDRSFPLVLVMDQGKVVQVVVLTGIIFNKVPE